MCQASKASPRLEFVDMTFQGKVIKGVLLDINGVLAEGTATGFKAIQGSLEAVKKLQEFGMPVRFVTNETQRTRQSLATVRFVSSIRCFHD